MIGGRHLRDAAAVLTGRRKVFYGWWLLACSVVAVALGSGVSFWSFGLYITPLEDEFGWSRAEVSFGFSAGLLVSSFAGPFIGQWIDTRGPRSAIIVGGVLTGLTTMLLAATGSLWQWYAFHAVNAVCRQMMFFIPFQTLVSRWFDRRRGIALGILGTGFLMGGFIVVPLLTAAIAAFGWRGSYIIAGVAIFVVFVPIGVRFVRNAPADLGLEPDGETRAGAERAATPARGLTLRQALRTPLFWFIAGGLTLFFFGVFGWSVHQVPFYESKGFSRGTAAAIVSAAAGTGIFVRLAMGLIADRFARFEVVIMGLVVALIGGFITLLIDSSGTGIAIFLAFWIVGTSAGPMLEAMVLTRAFGVVNFASILGAIILVETVGQIASPSIAGAIFDGTGSYDWALVMFIGAYVLSFLFFAIASRLKRPLADESRDRTGPTASVAAS